MTVPSLSQIKEELEREKAKQRRYSALRKLIIALIIAAAIAALLATRWMPVLRIYGTSMAPTLEEGQIVVTLKTNNFEQGDIVALYYENRILVKRYIADGGSWVDIMDDGKVFVDKELLYEPYITDQHKGNCEIELPYQVPEDRIFVMGDHRKTSMDSRSKSLGCIAEEQIAGRIVFCIWPLKDFGRVK